MLHFFVPLLPNPSSSSFFLKAATPFDGFSAPDISDLSFPYSKSQPDVKISIKAMTKINIALIFYTSYLNPLTKLPYAPLNFNFITKMAPPIKKVAKFHKMIGSAFIINP